MPNSYTYAVYSWNSTGVFHADRLECYLPTSTTKHSLTMCALTGKLEVKNVAESTQGLLQLV